MASVRSLCKKASYDDQQTRRGVDSLLNLMSDFFFSGYWFSSHEQWKILEMPYLDVDLIQSVRRNLVIISLRPNSNTC